MLLSLPCELHHCVFLHLSHDDLLRCSLLCHAMHSVVMESEGAWKGHFEASFGTEAALQERDGPWHNRFRRQFTVVRNADRLKKRLRAERATQSMQVGCIQPRLLQTGPMLPVVYTGRLRTPCRLFSSS